MAPIKRLFGAPTLSRCCLLTLFLFIVTLPLGCGPSILVPDTVPVKGVVNFKGKPARGIRVVFHNQDGSPVPGFVPTAETGPEGDFSMSTGAPHNGAPPGFYVVTFERPIIDPKNPIETEIDGFAGKYSDPSKSKWTVTVAEGENVLQPFELE